MAKWTYFHSMDPFMIAFTEGWGLRWYSMAYIVAFILGYGLLLRLLHKKQLALSQVQLSDLVFYVAVGVILGGRFGYALFYAPGMYFSWDSSFPYWEVLKIHQGGLASHGGIIGLIVAVAIFSWRRGVPAFHCLDLTVLGGSIGIFFGRIANFINGELFGRVIDKKSLFATQFPQEMFFYVSKNNIEALRALNSSVTSLNTAVTSAIWDNWVSRFADTGQYRGQIQSVIRALMKAVEQGRQEVILALKEVINPRYPSQIYQALLEGLLPFIIVWMVYTKRAFFGRLLYRFLHKVFPNLTPNLNMGFVAGVWGFCYCFARLLGEQFRMPDAHIGFQLLGLTRGQWLTLGMLVGMTIYLILVFKKSRPLGTTTE